MGCGVSSPLFTMKEKKVSEEFNHSIAHELVHHFDHFQLVHSACPSDINYHLHQGNIVTSHCGSSKCNSDRMCFPEEDGVFTCCHSSESAEVSRHQQAMTKKEDCMTSYLSRNGKVLVQDLESLLCTRVVQIKEEEDTVDVKKYIHRDDNIKFYDVALLLNITDSSSNHRSKRFLTFSHRAILAARSLFFSSQFGAATQQRLVASLHRQNSSLGGSSLRQSLPEWTTNSSRTYELIHLSFDIPKVVGSPSSFMIVLEYMYTGLFRPELLNKFKSCVERNNLTLLIEILALAQFFSVPQLKNCTMFHMCDLVEKNREGHKDFQSFMKALCPTIHYSNFKMEVKLCLEVEHVFNEYRKVKRKFFYSPMQSKKQLEKDFEKMYIQSNTNSMSALSFIDFTDVRLSIATSTRPVSVGSSMNLGRSSRKIFRIHRSILTARSVYFREYFLNCGVMSDVIDMPTSLTFSVLKAFVHFLYTDTIREEQESLLPDLLPLANQYGVAGLKALCLKSYYESLTKENVQQEYLKQTNNMNTQLRELCIFKMAFLFPELITEYKQNPILDDEDIKDLKNYLPLLHLRIHDKLSWNRIIVRNLKLEELLVPNTSKIKSRTKPRKLRLTIVGPAGVGKRTLAKDIKKAFPENEPMFLEINFSVFITVNIVAQLNSRSLETVSSDGFLLLFSLSDSETFREMLGMYETIKYSVDKPIVLVGNKADLQAAAIVEHFSDPDAYVRVEKALQLARQLKVPYIESQCISSINTRDMVIMLVKEILLAEGLHVRTNE